MNPEAIDASKGSSRRGIGNSTPEGIPAEHERSAGTGGLAPPWAREGAKVSAEFGGVHSTVEAGESRWREGTLVLGANEGEESQETGLCPTSSGYGSESSEEALRGGQEFFACPHVKPVRELDAGNPPVQFDEREVETNLPSVVPSSRVRRPRRGWLQVTAPPLDSTTLKSISAA